MAFWSKDDFEDEKQSLTYIDYSNLLVFTKDELDKALSRLPDLRLKSDGLERNALSSESSTLKVFRSDRPSHSSPRHSFTPTLPSKASHSAADTEAKSAKKFPYMNPVPPSMNHLNLNDFCGTEIDWKMLTLSRPPNKTEEDYFSKLVELTKLRHKTRIEDGYGFRKAVFRLSRHPRVMQYKPVSLAFDSIGFESNENSKSMFISEDTAYEAYARVPVEVASNELNDESIAAAAELLSSSKSFDLKAFAEQ